VKPLRGKQVEQPKLERRDLRNAGLLDPLSRAPRWFAGSSSRLRPACEPGCACIRGCVPYGSPSRTSRPAGTATNWRSCGLGAVLPILNIVPLRIRVPTVRWASWGAMDTRCSSRFTPFESRSVCRPAALGTRRRHPPSGGCATLVAAVVGRSQRFEAFGLPLRAEL